MGRIVFPQFPPQDANRPKIAKGHILPIHTPISLPEKGQSIPLSGWNPGIPVPSDITPEERDLFRAKSITLVRSSPLDCPVEKWIQSIQNTPIVRVVKEESSESPEGTSTVTLQQMLPIHQGVLIEVSFERKGTQRCLSIPLQASFHLSKSPCKAHPLPRQHTGWALSEELFTPPEKLAAEKNAFHHTACSRLLFSGKNGTASLSKAKCFSTHAKAVSGVPSNARTCSGECFEVYFSLWSY